MIIIKSFVDVYEMGAMFESRSRAKVIFNIGFNSNGDSMYRERVRTAAVYAQ